MSLPLPPPRAPAAEEFAPEPEVADREPMAPRRTAPSGTPRAGRRGLRGLATAAIIALLVGGFGGAAALGWRAPADAWNGIRRQSSGAWAGLRGHSFTAVWVSVRRHAWDAWLAIRRHTPFDAPEAAKASVAPSSKEIATSERGTHRRTKAHAARHRGD
jgi:hypothetical protein